MLSSESLSRYREGMDALSEGAAEYVAGVLSDAVAASPDLTVADLRDLAIEAMGAAVEKFGEMSSALACELYDMQSGDGRAASTTQRVTATRSAERVARYQAGRLADGDLKSFSRACADYVSDCVRRVAGQTIMDNCRRSSATGRPGRGGARRRYRHPKRADRGVRFARIPQGGDTCTFCAMLASRGFVYWSAETAGKFDHFHRGCRCLVVADADGAAEGYDPAEWADRWHAFEETDARADLTAPQKGLLKRGLSSGPLLRTRADPALEYFGPAEEDDPEALADLKAWLSDAGVEVKLVERRGDDEEGISYGPSARPGGSGVLTATEGMSLSAWMHEVDHARYDIENGRPGLMAYLMDYRLREEMERRAYGIEISLAREAGYNELAYRLQVLLGEEIDRLEADFGHDS